MTTVGEEIPLESQGSTPLIDDFRLMSLPIALRYEDDRLTSALRWHLAPFRRDQPQRDSYDVRIVQASEDQEPKPWRLTYMRGGERRFRGSGYRVLRYALWDLHSLVFRDARDFLFLHAGAVALGERRLILPAAPGAGKSTLVASLLSGGFEYLSDELASIDPVTSGVYPFPKHVAVANEALGYITGGVPTTPDDYPVVTAELKDRYLRPIDLGSSVGRPGAVDLVVFIDPDRGGTPRLHPLSPAEALARMLDHALNTELYGDRAVKILARVAKNSDAYELRGGSSAARAEVLKGLANGAPRQPSEHA